MDTRLELFQHRFLPRERGLTLLLLHGTGGNEDDLIPLGEALAPKASLLSPRGRVLEAGMPRFFRRIRPGVFDLEDLERRAEELRAFVTDAADVYGFDPASVVAAGFSNGANMAAALALLYPDVLAGAVLFSPSVPLDPGPTGPRLDGKPIFIGAGQIDDVSPIDDARRLASILERQGASVTLREYAQGHTITPSEVRDAALWIAERWQP